MYWDILRALLRLTDIYAAIFSSKAYPYLLLRAQMLPTSSPNAEKATIEAIVDGLRLSSIFNFEPILALPNITLVRDHCLFKLLRVFMGRGLVHYKAWLSEHEGELSKHGEPLGVLLGLSTVSQSRQVWRNPHWKGRCG